MAIRNLVPFRPTAEQTGQPPQNALFGAGCASTALCILVGSQGRIFTATDPFSVPTDPPHRAVRPPATHTILMLAEHFWESTRSRHCVRARFHFYSPTRNRGFECKRDRHRYHRCRIPLRYRVGYGRHVLRVRAIGPTGLRDPAAIKRFEVLRPRQHPHLPRSASLARAIDRGRAAT
jgi:hypothetical protein